MPLYFFDIDDGGDMPRDTEGTDLRDVEAARTAAMNLLPEIARCRDTDGGSYEITSSVRTEAGDVVFRAKLSLVADWVDTSKPTHRFRLG